MRIENLRSEARDNKARVMATVVWEDCDRPTRDVYFEVEDAFAQDLSCNPHAFLVGSIVPAMRHGEGRIAIDEEICPELRNGLATAMGWLCHWYGPRRRPVQIESKVRTRPPSPCTPERAGLFLSGGVDSLATLRANRLDFPVDHPRSVQDCVLVHGFDIGAISGADQEWEAFERARTSLSQVTKDACVTLIPVSTNVRHLDHDVLFWMHEFHGAALSAVAHAMSNRLTRVSVASSFAISYQQPWGSHPLLDPNYSSADLRILHDGLRFSRLDKVRLVANWDVALQSLRVCTMNLSGMLNCGKCEKCIRTMTELLAVGRLAHTQAFLASDVSADMLESIDITVPYEEGWYRELIDPLTALGRHDLVKVIQMKLTQFHRHVAWEQERDWKGAVKRFDRRYLGASLFRSYKAMREQVKRTQLP